MDEHVPIESASDGTQVKEETINPEIVRVDQRGSVIATAPIEDVIKEWSLENPRALGGGLAARILAAATQHVHNQLRDMSCRIDNANLTIDRLKTESAVKDVTIAVQKEQIVSLSRGKYSRLAMASFSTVLFGFAIDFFRNNMIGYGLSFIVMAVVLGIGTVLSAPRRDAK
ncbi:MAG: hypothetical protein PHR77_10445 [Kiritimatiellae bacterium]|nr:hypothetical protein [Kiritimatiellia bacterium]MDD5522746.1 hypothetical protein [Kiritimatiellia bacterium]